MLYSCTLIATVGVKGLRCLSYGALWIYCWFCACEMITPSHCRPRCVASASWRVVCYLCWV